MLLWLVFLQNLTFKKERTNIMVFYYNFYLEKGSLMCKI